LFQTEWQIIAVDKYSEYNNQIQHGVKINIYILRKKYVLLTVKNYYICGINHRHQQTTLVPQTMLPQMPLYINPSEAKLIQSEAKLYKMYHKLLDEIYLAVVD
jgi:hypothetical protein